MKSKSVPRPIPMGHDCQTPWISSLQNSIPSVPRISKTAGFSNPLFAKATAVSCQPPLLKKFNGYSIDSLIGKFARWHCPILLQESRTTRPVVSGNLPRMATHFPERFWRRKIFLIPKKCEVPWATSSLSAETIGPECGLTPSPPCSHTLHDSPDGGGICRGPCCRW